MQGGRARGRERDQSVPYFYDPAPIVSPLMYFQNMFDRASSIMFKLSISSAFLILKTLSEVQVLRSL